MSADVKCKRGERGEGQLQKRPERREGGGRIINPHEKGGKKEEDEVLISVRPTEKRRRFGAPPLPRLTRGQKKATFNNFAQ